MRQDKYSEDEIDFALAALELYRGDFAKAAKFVGVPIDYLRRWKHLADRAGQKPKEPLAPVRRPFPPDSLLEDLETRPMFAPAPDVWEWMQKTFISGGAILENEDHAHLQDAVIGVLWTNVGNAKQ